MEVAAVAPPPPPQEIMEVAAVALPPPPPEIMELAALSIPEQFKYKNRLQEYAQKSSIPLPQYQIVNEGYQHAPQFKASVYIGGEVFRSPHTFTHRKEAEQDVAKIALENLSRKIKPVEEIPQINPQIYQNAAFCKSILHEYTVKANVEKPMYSTSRSEGQLPLIVGSVALDGKTYKGDPGRNKKEAEQTAARAAIKSILENTSTRNLMAKIIQSKAKFYSAVHRYNVPGSSEGGEVRAILGGSVLVGVTNSQEMPVGPVAQSLPLKNKIIKKEYTYDEGSAANADAQQASLAQAGSTLIAFESSGEYYHPQGDQVRDGRQILVQLAQTNDSKSELQSCSAKRLMEQSEGHQLKQARVDG